MARRTKSPKATIISMANQKGGVAKTTSVASLGAAFAEAGKRVLLVDLDPQACLTFSLGIDPDAVEVSINEVVLGRAEMSEAVIATQDGVDLVPSTIDLAGAEAQLLPRPGREYVLAGALDDVAKDYDIILLDCSPTLGVLTLNALTDVGDPRQARPARRGLVERTTAVGGAQFGCEPARGDALGLDEAPYPGPDLARHRVDVGVRHDGAESVPQRIGTLAPLTDHLDLAEERHLVITAVDAELVAGTPRRSLDRAQR